MLVLMKVIEGRLSATFVIAILCNLYILLSLYNRILLLDHSFCGNLRFPFIPPSLQVFTILYQSPK